MPVPASNYNSKQDSDSGLKKIEIQHRNRVKLMLSYCLLVVAVFLLLFHFNALPQVKTYVQAFMYTAKEITKTETLALRPENYVSDASVSSANSSKANSLQGSVLAAKDRVTNFVFNINVPTFIKNTLSVSKGLTVTETLNVGGIATLSGGTSTSVLTFTGAATMNGLSAIDNPTQTTLEGALELTGDVTGTLNNNTISSLNGVSTADITDDDGAVIMVVGGSLASVPTTEITSLGEITEGTWKGDPIESAYLDLPGFWLTNGLTYTFPSAHTSNTILVNDGTGALTWTPAATTGGLEITPAGIRLISTCPNSSALIYNSGLSRWECSTSIGDASMIDGLDSSQFLRSDVADSFTGSTLTVGASSALDIVGSLKIDNIAINVTANEFNTLSGITASTSELNFLDGMSVTSVGVVYTDGTKFANTGIGTDGYILMSHGSSAPSWVSPDDIDAGGMGGVGSDSYLRSDTSDSFTSGTLTLDLGTILDANGDLIIADADVAFDSATGTNFNLTGNFSINNNNLFVNKSTGYVGVGNTSPTAPLTTSNVDLTGKLGVGYTSSTISNGVAAFNGNVGIGTTNPSASLEVAGSIKSTDYMYVEHGGPVMRFVDTTSGHDDWQASVNSDTFSLQQYANDTTWTTRLFVNAQGYVGIGTTAPLYGLVVNNGNIHLPYSAGNFGLLFATGGDTYDGGEIQANSSENYKFIVNNMGSGRYDLAVPTGYIGIGTTAPTANLEIYNTTSAKFKIGYDPNRYSEITYGDFYDSIRFKRFSTASGMNRGIMFTANANFRPNDVDLIISENGNIGIGITLPGAKLDIGSTTGGILRLTSSTTDMVKDALGGKIEFYNFDASVGSPNVHGYIQTRAVDWGANVDLDFGLATSNSDNTATLMTLKNTGLLGIGTTVPSAILTVHANGSWVNNALHILGVDGDNPTRMYALKIDREDGVEMFSVKSNGSGVGFNGYLAGRLGIGTSAPATTLHISGSDTTGVDANIPQLLFENTATTGDYNLAIMRTRISNGYAGGYPELWIESRRSASAGTLNLIRGLSNHDLLLTTNNTDRLMIKADGKVGINQSAPGYQFHVTTPDNGLAFIGNSVATNAHYTGLAFGYYESGPAYVKSALVQEQLGDGSARGKVHILNDGTADNSNATLADARLTVTYAGDIGIGTTSPSSRLEVSGGDIRVTGGSFIDDGTSLTVPDYVFEDEYVLMSLAELRDYVAVHKHLPNVPDMNDISGWASLSMQDRDMRLLEKIEENILYTLNNDSRISKMEALIGLLNESSESSSSVSGVLASINIALDEFKTTLASLGLTLVKNTSNEDVLTIPSHMAVLGDTTLADVAITGDLTVGTLKMDSLNNSLDVLGVSCVKSDSNLDADLCDAQTLYLQKGLAGNVNMFDGKVVLTADGSVKMTVLVADELRLRGDSGVMGRGVVKEGDGEVRVFSAKVRAGTAPEESSGDISAKFSNVFVTPLVDTEGVVLYIKEVVDGESFVVAVSGGSAPRDIDFNWLLVSGF